MPIHAGKQKDATSWPVMAKAIAAVFLFGGCTTLTQSPPAADLASAESRRYDFEPGCRETVHAAWPLRIEQFVDRQPEPITKVVPVYPDLAREAGVDGKVVIRALVCEHGRVVDTQLIKSIPMLDAAAVKCVTLWTFEPARVGGQAVSCWTEVPVGFSLK